MKRPTWATIVGIVGIIVGCLGLLGGSQSIMMPKMIDMHEALWADTKAFIEQNEITEPHQMPSKKMLQMMEKMSAVPDWFSMFCIIAGITAFFVSGFYIFASIRILQARPSAINLFYAAAGISIGFAILKTMIVMSAISFMGMGMITGGLLGIVINAVLLIVVATGEKDAFVPREA